MLLHRVVSESTVCLMSHERRQTLVMIDRLAFQVGPIAYFSFTLLPLALQSAESIRLIAGSCQ